MTSQQALLEKAKRNSRVDCRRKAEREHQEDPEREDGKRTRTEEEKRKTVERQPKNRKKACRGTLKNQRTLEREKTETVSEGTQETVELEEVEVNEEDTI